MFLNELYVDVVLVIDQPSDSSTAPLFVNTSPPTKSVQAFVVEPLFKPSSQNINPLLYGQYFVLITLPTFSSITDGEAVNKLFDVVYLFR